MEDLEPPGPSDTILMEDLNNCNPDHNGQFTFEYQDTIYQFTNPSVTVSIDTIPGSAYFLPDTFQFFRKRILIEERLNENQEIILTIEEVQEPFSKCLPLKEYYESSYFYYENGLNDCHIPNPDNLEMTVPLCSSASASLKTKYKNGVGYSYSSRGSLEVAECSDGSISGYFENEIFKRGRFCNVKVDWH